MQITLFIDSKEKTFTVPFVKGRMLRRVIEINKDHDLNKLDLDSIDELVDFVVEIYGGQFTCDDFYDGIAAEKMIDILVDHINKVAGVGGKAKDPNIQKG